MNSLEQENAKLRDEVKELKSQCRDMCKEVLHKVEMSNAALGRDAKTIVDLRAEVERLRGLVKSSFTEGWVNGVAHSQDGYSENDWNDSVSRQELENGDGK